jgi:uncharacterized tellurite resistance protein B-like protein
MDISDIYLSIGQKRNISHFANIVRIAKSDQEISTEEVEMLSRIANKYSISNDRFKQILKEPEKIPTLAHLECEERVERLYELLQMVEVDHKIEQREVNMLKKIVIGLAFPLQSVDKIVEYTIQTDIEVTDMEEFKIGMYKLLKMKFN